MSDLSRILNNTTAEMAHAWHPVALADEVTDRPQQVKLMGETWVLWRVDGRIQGLRDLCPHRNAPLSAGCVVDGALECPYHGWRFAPGGRCVAIPALGEVSPPQNIAARAPAGLEERYGLVWMAPLAPKATLISIPEWDAPEFRRGIMPPLRTRASAAQIVDNFLDVTHFYFLHRNSFGLDTADPIRFYHVERRDTEVVLHHQTRFSNGSGPLLPRTAHYHCTLPYQCRLVAEFPGNERRDMIALVAQPEDANTTRIYKLLAYNWTDADQLAEMLEFETQVIQEDIAMTEALPSTSLPLDTRAQAHARGDEIGLAWRQALQRLFWADSVPERLPANSVSERGLVGGKTAGRNPADRQTVGVAPLTVLWASQTGQAQSLAEAFCRQLQAAGLVTESFAMDEIQAEQLSSLRFAVLISSSTGDGEAPDNGSAFWADLCRPEMPRLNNLHYAVLGLGDRAFDTFCAHGRHLDTRLQQLGATALRERMDMEAPDVQPFAQWQDQLLGILLERIGRGRNVPPSVPVPDRVHRADQAKEGTGRLLASQRLGHPDHERFLTHCIIDIASTGLAYEAGDLLTIRPCNPESEVSAFLDAAGYHGAELVELDGQSLTLVEALSTRLDIRRWGPAALEARDAHASVQALVEQLRPLQLRRYSIASSPKVEAGCVHLLVTGQREGGGLCSSYLAQLAPGAALTIGVQANPRFRLPSPETPLIMMGAGSGLAPFRGFLQDRLAAGSTGKNWLFFGDRHEATDFHFRDEILSWQQSGHLHRLHTAFSRDLEQPIYVQDRLLEQGAELWDWLQGGAVLYLCGSRQRLAKGVNSALERIVQVHGQRTAEEAAAFLANLQREGRWRKDIY